MKKHGTFKLKKNLAEMLKGGVIMDVVNSEQAKIAEDSGAVSVMALERIPSDIRSDGGVARMSSVEIIEEVMEAVTIPVMAKARIGHFVEAQILESLGIDFIDESEVLTPADESNHINKNKFITPFVCGATSIGEAARRISEGAAMIRTKGEAGTGDISQAVKHFKLIKKEITHLTSEKNDIRNKWCNQERVDVDVQNKTLELGRLPVVTFAAGGIATPADGALMMHLGVDGIFVGSGIFESSNPSIMAQAMCKATIHYNNFKELVDACNTTSEPMKGIDCQNIETKYALR